jgi:bifunctional UDP-N-acetylglucosamine pyrophosphorylase/glucosamine-1-phosphate N-acetyltransferase
MKAVILAAGKGTRMKQDFPKALTPVAGKPILQYLIESIETSGIAGAPIIVVGPERPKLCETFGKECAYAVQEEQLGTGHAVASAKEAVGETDAVIVLYGDHPFLSAESLKKLAVRHEERGNTVTMMTTVVPDFEDWHCAFSHWGRIRNWDSARPAKFGEARWSL